LQLLKFHVFPLRVYYEDTDFSGVVYHASYLRFLERGRTEWLRDLGVDQRSLFEAVPPIGFAVRHMDIGFIKPALMDDELKVETKLIELGGASLTLDQRLLRGEELLVSAKVRIACVSLGKAARLPAALKLLLTV
jgi:acyl-CoA thioester hydrolase